MTWNQPPEEQYREYFQSINFSYSIGAIVTRIQRRNNDDGGTDSDIHKLPGYIEVEEWQKLQFSQFLPPGTFWPLETRSKGFPNHSGVSRPFPLGWETPVLRTGIYLNERTLRGYEGKRFIYLVEFKGFSPRYCALDSSKIAYLLSQPCIMVKITNSGRDQPTRLIPLKWFKTFDYKKVPIDLAMRIIDMLHNQNEPRRYADIS